MAPEKCGADARETRSNQAHPGSDPPTGTSARYGAGGPIFDVDRIRNQIAEAQPIEKKMTVRVAAVFSQAPAARALRASRPRCWSATAARGRPWATYSNDEAGQLRRPSGSCDRTRLSRRPCVASGGAFHSLDIEAVW